MKQFSSGTGSVPLQQGGSHLNYEVEAWLREMDFMVSEISHMITRLAFVVDIISGDKAIADAEEYQSRLLAFHEQMQGNRELIKEHREILKLNKVAQHPGYGKKNVTNHAKLRKTIVLAEKDYMLVKNDFNSFIAKLSGVQ